MKNNKAKRNEAGWKDIKVRDTTVKRLRIAKANMEVPVYDDVINVGLNLIEEGK